MDTASTNDDSGYEVCDSCGETTREHWECDECAMLTCLHCSCECDDEDVDLDSHDVHPEWDDNDDSDLDD